MRERKLLKRFVGEIAGNLRPAGRVRRGQQGLRNLWVKAAGYQIHARSLPPRTLGGESIVLVHGLGVSSRYLMPTAWRLSDRYRTYVPDLPGTGRSQRPQRALSMEELANVLLSWMDAVALPRAVLLGNSLGCQVIVEAAIQAPERVSQLVLVAPTMDRAARGAWRQIGRFMINILGEPLSLYPIVVMDYVRFGPIRFWNTLNLALRHPLEDRLPMVRCPTLVVIGSGDPIVPERWAAEVARRLSHGLLCVLPGGSHALNYSMPEELSRVTLRFLEASETGR